MVGARYRVPRIAAVVGGWADSDPDRRSARQRSDSSHQHWWADQGVTALVTRTEVRDLDGVATGVVEPRHQNGCVRQILLLAAHRPIQLDLKGPVGVGWLGTGEEGAERGIANESGKAAP